MEFFAMSSVFCFCFPSAAPTATVAPQSMVHVSRGICRGELSLEASGNEGFGFDPIFIPDAIITDGDTRSTSGLTFADVDLSVKEQFSHRRKALDGLIELLLTTEAASSS